MLLCGWSPPAGAERLEVHIGQIGVCYRLVQCPADGGGKGDVLSKRALRSVFDRRFERMAMRRYFRLEQRHGLRPAGFAEIVQRQARALARDASARGPAGPAARSCTCRCRHRWCRAARTARCSATAAGAARRTNAQPLGAKLNGKMRISATKGSAMMSSSGRRRENAEQRDDEVDAEIGLEVGVRLAAADGANRGRRHVGGEAFHLRKMFTSVELASTLFCGFAWCSHCRSIRAERC